MWEWGIVAAVVYIYSMVVGGDAQQVRDEENNLEGERRRNRSSGSPYPVQLVNDFETLALTLKPSDEYLNELGAVAKKIWQYLLDQKPQHRLEIDRYKIGGSSGKGTCISYIDPRNGKRVNSDLDMIIFINSINPPFRNQLQIFANFLRDLDEVSGVIVRNNSIEFKIWSKSQKDIKVDLLAAQNFVEDSHSRTPEDIAKLQARAVLQNLDIKQQQAIAGTQHINKKENRWNSSALAEETIRIIENFVKDPYVRNVVRICKYWNCYVNLDIYGYVPARSCIMELIAIKCQQTVGTSQQGHGRCPISGLRRFLEDIKNFPNLDISSNNNEENARRLVKEDNKPMVRDPVNYWNNLAEGIPEDVIKIWQDQAEKTLSLLEELRNNSDFMFENAIDVHDIFRHKVDGHTVLEMEE